MKNALKGVFAPIVTVFDENGRMQLDRMEENLRWYNTTALTGYMPLGSNGEFQGLTEQESLDILRLFARASAPEKLIFGGCGRESPQKTLEFIEKAAALGLDYAFLLPPHYFTALTTEEGLYRFFRQVADESPLPIVLYNAPKFAAGLTLSPELVARLAEHPNIAALKNSSTVPDSLYRAAVPDPDFLLISGSIKTFYTGLRAGAVGGVLSTATYLPEYCCRLYERYAAGQEAEAAEQSRFLMELSAQTVGPLGVAGVKCGLELRGLAGGRVRLPLLDVSAEDRARIASAFAAAGIAPVR